MCEERNRERARESERGSDTQLRRVHVIGHKDLNIILTALSHSVGPVSNACLILLVISCVYAILGTQVFGEDHPELFGRFQVLCMAHYR